MGESVIWRKPSRSGPNGDNCVEVATTPGAVMVRDSQGDHGEILTVTRDEWRRFLHAIRRPAS